MPKKNNNKPQREMTKRQLSHWQRENRLQRIIMLTSIVVIVAILAIVGTGLYMNKYKPYHVTVIKVGNTEYSMDYYINMLAYYGTLYGSPQMIQYLGDTVAQAIEQHQIVVQEAAKLGITVSDDAVKQEIKKENLTMDQTRIDTVRYNLVLQKLQSDYFDKQVPDTAEQRNVQAMFLESQSQVDAVKARLDKGESFADIASQLSLEKTSKDNKGDFGWVPQGVLNTILYQGNNNTAITDKVLDNQVFAKDTSANSLTSVEDKDQVKNIGYWLVEVTETRTVSATPTPTPNGTATTTPATTTQAHVLTMLLGSEQQADEIKAKLEQGGEGNDWATLAKANSLDSKASSGGDWGFVSKGTIGEDAVDKVVFPDNPSQALPPKIISDPIPDTTQSTEGGFWLVQVNGIENQKITDSNRTILSQNLLSDWANKIWTDNQSTVQNLLTDSQKSFAIAQAEKR